MQSTAKTPAEYLAEIPEERRRDINALRKIIRQVAPGVKESMQYGMLAYALDEPLFCLASQKQYLALYVDGETLARYQPRLGRLSCGKSCLRFKSLEQLPLDVITELLTECVAQQKPTS